MHSYFGKHWKIVSVILSIIVGMLLVISAILMLVKYKNEITERSSSAAKYNTLIARNALEENLNGCTVKAVEIATKLSTASEKQVGVILNSYIEDTKENGIKFNRYYDQNGVLRDADGTVYTGNEDISVAYREANPDKAGYIGTYDDTEIVVEGAMSVIGFYAPVHSSAYVTGVVNYYTRQTLVELFESDYSNADAEFTAVCIDNGKIVSKKGNIDATQIIEYLSTEINKETSDKVQKYIVNGEDTTILTKINGDDYLISVGGNKGVLIDLSVVELYRVDVLYASSLDFVQTIIGAIVMFAVIIAGVIIYFFVSRRDMKKLILNMGTTDTLLECNNRTGFEKETRAILNVNQNSYFAVIVAHVHHYKRLVEGASETEVYNFLKFIKLTLAQTVGMEEVYGYDGNGEFLLLLHAKDKASLVERLKIHTKIAKQYKGAEHYDVAIRYGIYEYKDGEKVTVNQMIDFAKEANASVRFATVENGGMRFNFYSEELRQLHIANETMELRMEKALKNGEFQIFYQPKYNLNKKKQDGCEALVRWYDQKTDQYNRPALFMKLFETNGFIVKLDKYVYTKVCEYISYSIAKGRTVYPVSVNISRVTAIQSDFVDFYIKIKKKYSIPDGLIMIEFTESFAYENYETLSSIVNRLHDAGFKCSIDDFGCGYSSYRILKTLTMDEIKLDKFFLEKSNSQKRDMAILKSVIALARELELKITQEGVETKEELEMIKELGCDVVQGYYYAHPLGLNDYLSFVERSNEHNI